MEEEKERQIIWIVTFWDPNNAELEPIVATFNNKEAANNFRVGFKKKFRHLVSAIDQCPLYSKCIIK